MLFIVGLDLSDLGSNPGLTATNLDVSRKAFLIRNDLKRCQESFNVIEKVSSTYCTNGHKSLIRKTVSQ
jgi:hypothetical protein